MVTYLPFLLMVTVKGATFPLLVYSDNIDNAFIKATAEYPGCQISNNTLQ